MKPRFLSFLLLSSLFFLLSCSSSLSVQAQGTATATPDTALPNKLLVTRIPLASGHVVQSVTQVRLIQQIYTHEQTLSKQPAHQVCPSYIIGIYHLNFSYNTKPLENTTFIEAGCPLVILNQKDVRIPDPLFYTLLQKAGILSVAGSVQGLAPTDLQDAYHLASESATVGQTQTIAIIDAYNDPNAERDLAVYRSYFHLPACTTTNGCFRKVNQAGGTWAPQNDPGWSLEIALDLDMVSALCPLCHILLVEANTPSFHDLGNAVITAARLRAQTITNSYGSSEDGFSNQYAYYYNQPGHTVVASSGDNGYSVQVPAAYNTVIAVGGTSLTHAQNARGWQETAWNGTGSGCSQYIRKPSWQSDPDCSARMSVDVSAVADPATGVAVYGTYGGSGWMVFGGTSASSPLIAGFFALSGNATTITAQMLYSHPEAFTDITSGSNGTCSFHYFCTAGAGYDGPTGLGSPYGIAAFSSSSKRS